MIVLEIDEPTPSLNDFHHTHWTVAHKSKKLWDNLVWRALADWQRFAAKKAGDAFVLPSAATKKRRVIIERRGIKRLDGDNFVGGLKGILDVLKKHRLIVDDSDDWIDLVPSQLALPKGKKPHTIIIIEDSKT